MRRRDRAGNATDLPELDLTRLDDDERWYLRVMLGLIETGNMFHGRFVEVHVARILGADVPDTGTNEWDLFLPDPTPITIEVKATPIKGKYNLGSVGADVWVFVAYPDKTTRPRSFSYVVASASEVAALKQETMAQSKVFARFGPPVAEIDLLAEVRARATHSAHRR